MGPRVPCLSKVVPDFPTMVPASLVLGFGDWLALWLDPQVGQKRETAGGAVHRGGSMRASRGLTEFAAMPRQPRLVMP